MARAKVLNAFENVDNMNRKGRRANIKRGGLLAASAIPALPQAAGIEDFYAAAVTCYRNHELAPAENLCRAVLLRDPQHVRALVLLGDIMQQRGRNKSAVKLLEQALALDPFDAPAHDNIAIAYQSLGRVDEAVQHYTRAIALGLGDAEMLVKQCPAVAAALKRLGDAWPRHLRLAELLGAPGAGSIAREALLLALLQSKVVCDAELESLLTGVRRGLLQSAIEGGSPMIEADTLGFFCALAQQCFINEYVFALDDTERAQLQQVHDRIVDASRVGAEIAPLDLIVTASYLPLHRLPTASGLLSHPWPDAIARLVALQIVRVPRRSAFARICARCSQLLERA